MTPRRSSLVVFLFFVLLSIGYPSRPAHAESPPRIARLAFVGDIMLGRNVGTWVRSQGVSYPFEQIRGIIGEADLAFGNMESPLTTAPRVAGGYDLRAEPEYAQALQKAGFDVLSLANNHSTDNGRDGLLETMATLNELGIDYVGAGDNLQEARSPLIREVNGLRIAFLAYDETRACFQATATQAGALWLQTEWVVEDVKAARDEADLVIVSFHWGDEYQSLPHPRQRAIAQEVADAGADLIIGHHPHVVQPVEWIEGKDRPHPTLVAYSLGNFLFDQWFSEETMQAAILMCVVGENGVEAFGLYPVWVVDGRTEPADLGHGRAVLRRLLPEPPQWLWEETRTILLANELSPAVWWLHQDTPSDAGFSSRNPEHTLFEKILPAGWVLRAWSPAGTRSALSVAAPPTWIEATPEVGEFGVRLLPRSRLVNRLLLVYESPLGPRAGPPSRPLRQPVFDLACTERRLGGRLSCTALEGAPGVAAHVTRWIWGSEGWSQPLIGPTGPYASLLNWDAGDGRLLTLAGGRGREILRFPARP